MLKKTYQMIMDDTKNPFMNLPPVVRFQLMTVLAYMWCAIFSAGIGSYAVFGTTVVLHTLVLGGIFVTAYYFHNAQMQTKTTNKTDAPKILIIDDDELTAMTYAKFLEQDHIESRTVTNPLKAMKEIEMHKPDLIFMDIRMPYADGYEIAEAIYKTYGKENSPDIVFMTGALKETEAEYEQEALEKGSILLKPLQPKQMSNVIDIKTRQRRAA